LGTALFSLHDRVLKMHLGGGLFAGRFTVSQNSQPYRTAGPQRRCMERSGLQRLTAVQEKSMRNDDQNRTTSANGWCPNLLAVLPLLLGVVTFAN
jgi:hypothetical protein